MWIPLTDACLLMHAFSSPMSLMIASLMIRMVRNKVNHEGSAPVLDTCFSPDGSTVISAGCDKAVRMWKLGETPPNNVAQQVGSHDAPVSCVGFLAATNLIVSGGWDRKLKFWDGRQPNPAGILGTLWSLFYCRFCVVEES
jgi:WD40 repeat protein